MKRRGLTVQRTSDEREELKGRIWADDSIGWWAMIRNPDVCPGRYLAIIQSSDYQGMSSSFLDQTHPANSLWFTPLRFSDPYSRLVGSTWEYIESRAKSPLFVWPVRELCALANNAHRRTHLEEGSRVNRCLGNVWYSISPLSCMLEWSETHRVIVSQWNVLLFVS